MTEPPAETSRKVTASTEWFTIVNARATPTAAVAASELPFAVVVAEVVPGGPLADMVRDPVFEKIGPDSRKALRDTLATVIPNAPVTATPPPALAPVSAVVTTACPPVASELKSRAPFRSASTFRPAVTESLMIESATDAPMPVLSDVIPLTAGNARVVVWLVDEDSNETSGAPPRIVTDALAGISVLTLIVTTLRARVPATATLAPPAPDVAVAVNDPAVGDRASTVTPVDVKVSASAPPIDARVLIVMRLIAMATPTPAKPPPSVDPSVALPSAVAEAELDEAA